MSDRSWPSGNKPSDLGPLPLMPFVKSAIVFGNNLFKDMRRNRNVELVSVSWFDENVAVADFNIWRHFAKITRAHVSTPPRSRTSERFGIDVETNTSGKIVTCINSCFRQTADLFRRAETETSRVGAPA